jgi:hypothetical protein
MYTWFRTYSANIGKMHDLLAITHEAVEHLEKNHGLEVEIYTQLGGDPMKIGLVGRYQTLGDLGDREAAIAADKEWAAIVDRASSLVVEGSVVDQFWKKL